MKKLFLGFMLILLGCLFLQGQTVLTYEGQTYNNTQIDVWYGVNVPRSTPTTFTFRNNSVTSVNLQGYMLQAGDEGINAYNNNLKGELIIGNKFNWNGDYSGLGTAMTITHGLFTGCNIDVNIKYNYLNRVPMGIIRKSASNMVNTTGGVSYNIVKTFNVGGVVKGMSGVKWYNNTFYNDRPTYSSSDPTAGTWRGAIDVYTNTDVTPNSVSHGTKIKNNIFYSKYKTYAIDVMDTESLIDFECDYNVYWVEEGDHTPVFNAGGTSKTWAQWRAMGYDAHSVVMNPNFIDFVNFVPAARLDYGTDLGSEFNTGLATNATWVVGSSPATQVQNGTWQVGARIYAPVAPTPYLNVSTNAITIAATAGSTGNFNISSNTNWNISSSQSWLTPSVTSGSNNATITLTATANALTTTRTATITVSGTNVSNQIITVTQQGASAFLYVSKTNITIPSTANTDGKFNIISNTDWTITSSQPWLTVGVELYYSLGGQGYKTMLYSGTAPDIGAFEYMQTTATGHDSAFVTLTAEANTAYTSRNATVTVSGTGVSNKIVNVTQEASAPPVGIPIYVSSLIASATPNVIEMTYDKSLANIVPSTTAFTVRVNSISKDIVSVSISDTKVRLTLAGNVYSGNIVTVAYTKPEINPLQTPTGYQAESITAQPVTNNSTTIQTTFYISPTGSDVAGVGDGTFEDPWFTLNKGWSVLSAGRTLYLRGGIYYYDVEQDLRNKNGTVDNYIKVWAYNNEKPIFRPSTLYTGRVGITVEEVSYVHLKGLEVCYYEQRTPDEWYNGIIAADANYCIFEKLDVHHNGFGMSLGRWTTGNPVTGNLFLNCDFHHNYDPITAITTNVPYGGSDGLTIRVDNPNSVNTVRGCRMYNNSDDGFDGWYNAGLLILDNCWFFNNGYREDGVTEGGDGNGLKLGPLVADPWTGYETQHKRTVQNCIAFNNRVNGFDQNAALCVMYFYNNFAFGNGNHGFLLNNVNNIVITARNNISYRNAKGQAYFNSISILDHNTFTYNNGVNPMYSVSDADFVSIIPTGTDAARYPDGSLPTITFLQLADGSDLIKRGVDVGLPYTGTAPDLGPFDYLIKPSGKTSIVNKGAKVVNQGNHIINQ